MLRMLFRRDIKDHHNGAEYSAFLSVDIPRLTAVERLMTAGGLSENGYDVTTLLGVEVIPMRQCNACEWIGSERESVHPKHDETMILCPKCNETTMASN